MDNDPLPSPAGSGVHCARTTIQRRDYRHHAVHSVQLLPAELDSADVFIQLERHSTRDITGTIAHRVMPSPTEKEILPETLTNRSLLVTVIVNIGIQKRGLSYAV